jgi:AcrR family transcriptional regulator
MVGTTGELGRRERKKLVTRDALRAAALELMADRGFDGVTVEEICEEADVATSTFFRHFATKQDVILESDARRGARLIEALDSQPEGVAPVDLLTGTIQTWRLSRRPATELRAEAMLIAAEPALQAGLERIMSSWERPLAESIAARYDLDPAGLEVNIVAAWFVAAVRVVIREWSLSGADEDLYAMGVRVVAPLAAALERQLAG